MPRGEEMIGMVKEYGPDIVTEAGVSKSVGAAEFANSSGTAFTTEGTSYSAYVYGTRIKGTDILMAGDGYGWRKRQLDHRRIAQKAIEQFRLAERIASLTSGKPGPAVGRGGSQTPAHCRPAAALSPGCGGGILLNRQQEPPLLL